MPLKKGKSPIISSKFFCDRNIAFSFLRIAPVHFAVAISAQCFQIFWRIIFSVFVNMVNLKNINIFNFAFFTKDLAVRLKGLCKPFDSIIFLSVDSRIENAGTFPSAKSSNASICFIPASNYCAANKTRVSLDAFNRTISTFSSKFIGPKVIVACRAFSHFVFGFIRTFTRTINFSCATSAIVAFEGCITNKAIVHGGHYAIT